MNTDNLKAIAKTRIRRPPSEVFAAFSDADAMSRFWFTRRDDGLREGESSTWFLGSGEDAISFEVRVLELDRPNKLVIEWENECGLARVKWLFEETDDADTILTIEESGYTGSDDAIVARALDSTGGFNQVIVAAKALVEHGVGMNLVDDRA